MSVLLNSWIFYPLYLICIAISSHLAFHAGRNSGINFYGDGGLSHQYGQEKYFAPSTTSLESIVKGSCEAKHSSYEYSLQYNSIYGNNESSSLDNSDVFYEALVHPVMFMHNHPENVAIVGHGRARVLDHVLKHNTVNRVKIFSFDTLRNVEKPLKNSTKVETTYLQRNHWHLQRSKNKPKRVTGNSVDEKFDVIILDTAHDMMIFYSDIPSASALTRNVYETLKDDGVIVFYLGDSFKYTDPAIEYTDKVFVQYLIQHLSEAGFQDVFIYEESHCGSRSPCLFLLAIKNSKSKSLWYRNEAQIQSEIHHRINRNSDGTPYLSYFDGSVFQSYRNPHKVIETMYCRSSPTPNSCMRRPKMTDIPISNFRVGLSTIGNGSGRGVFTNVDIVKGSTIARKTYMFILELPPHAHDLMLKYLEFSDDHEMLFNYMDGYGWESTIHGATSYFSDSGILSFVNHGCNGNFNIDEVGDAIDRHPSLQYSFNPVMLRRHRFDLIAVRDIKAGDELFCDYTHFSTGEDFLPALDELNRMCNGETSIGLITQTERQRRGEAL